MALNHVTSCLIGKVFIPWYAELVREFCLTSRTAWGLRLHALWSCKLAQQICVQSSLPLDQEWRESTWGLSEIWWSGSKTDSPLKIWLFCTVTWKIYSWVYQTLYWKAQTCGFIRNTSVQFLPSLHEAINLNYFYTRVVYRGQSWCA